MISVSPAKSVFLVNAISWIKMSLPYTTVVVGTVTPAGIHQHFTDSSVRQLKLLLRLKPVMQI
jgi:hypothetical protein